jgi:hypothetical protein
MSYDDWKTTPPGYNDPDPVLHCLSCRYKGEHEEFERQGCDIYDDGEREEYTEMACPKCGSGAIEDDAEHTERLRDQYWQQKLDESLGK